MDLLEYVSTNDNGLSFELRVNGLPLAQLIGSHDTAIPYWIIKDDLPRYPTYGQDQRAEMYIVNVCSCGEYGCGHAACRIVKADDVVTFCDFDGDVRGTLALQVFHFTRTNYDDVVAAIVRGAREYAAGEAR
jgi:hypothetical protein